MSLQSQLCCSDRTCSDLAGVYWARLKVYRPLTKMHAGSPNLRIWKMKRVACARETNFAQHLPHRSAKRCQ